MFMEQIGQYSINEVIGDGGMGTVFKGLDPRFNRSVAIKILHDYLTRDSDLLERFKSEAIIQARLQHPNIVTVYDFLLIDSTAAMIMEYVEGQTLEMMIDDMARPMSYEECLQMFTQILHAMSYAHAQGLVHRDIKPSNILVRRFGKQLQVKVMDFGVAKILGSEKMRTATSAKIGTVCYMSPEQVKSSKNVDHRSDIYALGVTLFQMATGKMPFDDDIEFQLMQKIVQGDLRSPREVNPNIPGPFEEVILKAMAKEPRNRYKDCDEFLESLQNASKPEPVTVTPPVVELPPESPPQPIPEKTHIVKKPTSETISDVSSGVKEEKREDKRNMTLILGLAAIVLVSVSIGLALWMRPSPVTTRPLSDNRKRVEVKADGTLIVNMNPAGKAQLNGFLLPDGGQRVSEDHRFSGLEPKSYSLKVWSSSYSPVKRNVSVRSGKTTTETIRFR